MKTAPTVLLMSSLSLILASLSACGGGGNGTSPITNPSDARALTGLSAPAESPAAQDARAPGIVSRADSLIISTAYGNTNHADLPQFRILARCSGISCTYTEPTTGYYERVTISDFGFLAGSAQAIGTQYGITLVDETGSYQGADYSSLGAWMDHAGFAVQSISGEEQNVELTLRRSLAGGDLTGRRLAGSATWLGVMVGTPATGNGRGNRLVGTAALNYDTSASGGLDVAFSSIKDLDRNRSHTTTEVIFSDVPISSRGTFAAGLTGNRIQGGFCGPGHAEAAGIFEQANIVGAFGAERQ